MTTVKLQYWPVLTREQIEAQRKRIDELVRVEGAEVGERERT